MEINNIKSDVFNKERSKIEESSAFKEMTENLSQKEVENIHVKLSQLDSNKLKQVVQAIKEGITKSEGILSDSDLDDYVLRAMRDGLISKEELVTTMLVKYALQEEGVNLLNSAAMSELLQLGANQTGELTTREKELSQLLQSLGQFMGDLEPSQANTFLESVKSLPENEQTLYFADRKIDEQAIQTNHENAQNGLYNFGEIDVSSAYKDRDFPLFYAKANPKVAIVPSASLLQAYLNAKFGTDAVHINFVFGESSNKKMFQHVVDKRDFAVPIKDYPLPDSADAIKTPGIQFAIHDWFHCLAVSEVGTYGRQLQKAVWEKAKNKLSDSDLKNERVQDIFNGFVDLAALTLVPPSYGEVKLQIETVLFVEIGKSVHEVQKIRELTQHTIKQYAGIFQEALKEAQEEMGAAKIGENWIKGLKNVKFNL